MPQRRADVVVLGTDGPSTRAIFHALAASHPETRAIIERPIAPAKLIRGRLKRLGRRVVVGQLLFQTLVQRPLAFASRRRISEIVRENRFDLSMLPRDRVTAVESANDVESIASLKSMQPRVVVLSGTRIIARATLDAVDATFINMHAGITPRYRGVHGGYWALAEHRPDLVGTTIHIVDAGIDTGGVLEQVLFRPISRDNFATYPYLHLAYGLPALMRQVRSALSGALETRAPLVLESKLRYHPTLLEYLRGTAR